jgi:pyruvate ferredoxin oxidoreductase gamma subunit
MFQVRFHGRGGQGVVTAAELLSVAAFDAGLWSQAFPSFGSERTGAPVVAYTRIDDHEIRTREPVIAPDALVVQDVTLVHQVDLFAGLVPEGYVLINTQRSLASLGLDGLLNGESRFRVVSVPATEIAMEQTGRPLPNAVLLGGLVALASVVALAAVEKAIEQRFIGSIASKNIAGAREAYDLVRAGQAGKDAANGGSRGEEDPQGEEALAGASSD